MRDGGIDASTTPNFMFAHTHTHTHTHTYTYTHTHIGTVQSGGGVTAASTPTAQGLSPTGATSNANSTAVAAVAKGAAVGTLHDSQNLQNFSGPGNESAVSVIKKAAAAERRPATNEVVIIIIIINYNYNYLVVKWATAAKRRPVTNNLIKAFKIVYFKQPHPVTSHMTGRKTLRLS